MRALLVISLLLVTTTAAADPGRVTWIRGQGAAECHSVEELRARLDEQLGSGALEQPGARIEGFVSHQDGTWSAQIFARSSGGQLLGERLIESTEESCDALNDSVVLAMGLLLETVETSEPVADPEPRDEPPAAQTPADPAPENPAVQRLWPPRRALVGRPNSSCMDHFQWVCCLGPPSDSR